MTQPWLVSLSRNVPVFNSLLLTVYRQLHVSNLLYRPKRQDHVQRKPLSQIPGFDEGLCHSSHPDTDIEYTWRHQFISCTCSEPKL